MLRVAIALLVVITAHAATAVHCGKLIHPSDGSIVPDAMILIDRDLVIEAGPSAKTKVPPGADIIELAGATCLPGLIDVHTHLTSDPTNSGYRSLGISVPRMALTGARNARLTLLAGFTTVRNVGAKGYADIALRDSIAAGENPGPRVLASGPALSITGGHGDSNLLAPEYHATSGGVADGPWAVRAKVRENVKYGADVIKVAASGGVLSKGDLPGTPQYTLEELQAIVDEAHKLGRKVAAHAHGTQSIKDAIRAGVDSVEHSSLIDDEGIKLARERGTYLVFDVYNDDYILSEGPKVGMLPESIEKERQIGRTQRLNFRKAWLGGTKMAFGTDAGVYPHGDNAKQFAVMVEYGMKTSDAIRSATVSAADLLGMGAKAGEIQPGFLADMIAVAGDPLADIRALENVGFVMKGGKVYKNQWAK